MTIDHRLVGLSAAYAISMGLFARQRTGKAQEIDIPMFETVSSQVLSDHLYGRSFVRELGGSSYPRLLTAEWRLTRQRTAFHAPQSTPTSTGTAS